LQAEARQAVSLAEECLAHNSVLVQPEIGFEFAQLSAASVHALARLASLYEEEEVLLTRLSISPETAVGREPEAAESRLARLYMKESEPCVDHLERVASSMVLA